MLSKPAAAIAALWSWGLRLWATGLPITPYTCISTQAEDPWGLDSFSCFEILVYDLNLEALAQRVLLDDSEAEDSEADDSEAEDSDDELMQTSLLSSLSVHLWKALW